MKKNQIIKISLISLTVFICFFLLIQKHVLIQKIVDNADYTYPNTVSFNKTAKIDADKLVKINFSFIQKGWTDQWDNLFQTADVNKGIRLEFNRDKNTLTMVFSKKDGSLYGAPVTPTPAINKWHKFEVTIYKERVKIWVDSWLIHDKTFQDMSFDIDKIAVGCGFSKARLFNGEIKNFNLSIEKTSFFGLNINFLFYQTMLILAALILLFITASNKTAKKNSVDILLWITAFIVMTLALNKVFYGEKISNLSNLVLVKYELSFLIMIFLYQVLKKIEIKHLSGIILCSWFFAYLNSYLMPLNWSGMSAYFFIFFTIGVAASTLINLLAVTRVKKVVFIIIGILIFFIYLSFSFLAFYIRKTGSYFLKIDEASAFFQSNMQESFEFLTSFFSYPELFFMLFISFIATFLFSQSIRSNTSKKQFTYIGLVIAAAITASVLSYSGGARSNLTYNLLMAGKNYKQIASEMNKYRQLRESGQEIKAEKKNSGELYFLIIGEASNPDHWGAYGYFRDTTPWASKELKENHNALFFKNVYSSYVHTVPSLLKALTSANQYNKENDFSSPSIIETAKAAGFKVYWLSNQDKVSLVDNPLTVLAYGADNTIFTNKSRFGSDAELLPIIDKTLKSINTEENNLIIIHLIGSHAAYDKRYPKNFNVSFRSDECYLGNNARDKDFVSKTLNTYDTSILFTDSILKQIHEKFSSMPNDIKAMFYFSDHGEDVYGKKFHNSSIFSYPMARIPMFIVFSEKYKDLYPDIFYTLKQNYERVFTLDLLFNAMCGILDIETPLNENKYDFTSEEYSITPDNAITMYSDDNLQTNLYSFSETYRVYDDPKHIKKENLIKLAGRFPEKVFAALHVDALGGAIQALNEGFDTIEVNVSVPEMKIGHAPQFVYDMTFEEYLSLIPLDKVKTLWIDMKELKEEDIDEVIDKLNELDNKFNLKQRTLVENTLISPKMSKFTENGWKNCFYLFVKLRYDDINRGFSNNIQKLVTKKDPSEEDVAEMKAFAAMIAENIREQKSTDLSFYAFMYPYVKKYLEPLLPENIMYYTFAIENFPEIYDADMLNKIEDHKIANDKRVRIILINPETNFAITL